MQYSAFFDHLLGTVQLMLLLVLCHESSIRIHIGTSWEKCRFRTRLVMSLDVVCLVVHDACWLVGCWEISKSAGSRGVCQQCRRMMVRDPHVCTAHDGISHLPTTTAHTYSLYNFFVHFVVKVLFIGICLAKVVVLSPRCLRYRQHSIPIHVLCIVCV